VRRKVIETEKEMTTTYEKFMSVYRLNAGNGRYSTTMHYYNRDNTVIDETVNINPQAVNHIKNLMSPYAANTTEYQGNIVSKQFKENMIRKLGVDTICTV
jgi:hypothetical protein